MIQDSSRLIAACKGNGTMTHIRLDEHGKAWIDETKIKVLEVVLDSIGQGLSPQQIFEEHYHTLSMAQIHAALAYYYDHQAELDKEIEQQLQQIKSWRQAQGTDTPVHKKLRAAGKLP